MITCCERDRPGSKGRDGGAGDEGRKAGYGRHVHTIGQPACASIKSFQGRDKDRVCHTPRVPAEDPTALVTRFLDLLAEGQVDAAADLLSPDVQYTNVSLPTIRGRERVRKLGRLSVERGMRFEVIVHAASADGGVVLNERTDVLIFGRLRIQFWVFGRFEVRDGQITVWRDAFDWLDMTRGFLRGLAGMVVPSLGRH